MLPFARFGGASLGRLCAPGAWASKLARSVENVRPGEQIWECGGGARLFAQNVPRKETNGMWRLEWYSVPFTWYARSDGRYFNQQMRHENTGDLYALCGSPSCWMQSQRLLTTGMSSASLQRNQSGLPPPPTAVTLLGRSPRAPFRHRTVRIDTKPMCSAQRSGCLHSSTPLAATSAQLTLPDPKIATRCVLHATPDFTVGLLLLSQLVNALQLLQIPSSPLVHASRDPEQLVSLSSTWCGRFLFAHQHVQLGVLVHQQ